MGRSAVAARKDARRFDHYVGADVAPGYLGRVPLCEGLDLMVAHVQDVAVKRNVLGPDSVGRVVLEKVSQAIERHQVVRRHDLDVATVHRCFGEQHPDPAETIYAYSYGHSSLHSLACHSPLFCPKCRKIMQQAYFGSYHPRIGTRYAEPRAIRARSIVAMSWVLTSSTGWIILGSCARRCNPSHLTLLRNTAGLTSSTLSNGGGRHERTNPR